MANLKAPLLKRSSTAFLQIVIVLIGIAALAFLLWEPHVEGVNAHATLFQKYFNLFVVYVYIGSIPFFAALYQAFKVLGYAGTNQVFSPAVVKALRTIKFCAIALIGFVVVGEIFLMLPNSDEPIVGLFLGLLVTFPSIIVATAAATFEHILQNAVDLKSENDLTV